MADYFDFKGIRSTSLGVYVTEYPPAIIPEERLSFMTVPGRSGSLTVAEGEGVYEDLTLSVGCFAAGLSRRDELVAWLRGQGELILGSDETHSYRARAVQQLAFKMIVRGRSARNFDAVFRCAPFRYLLGIADISLTSPGTLVNPGTVFSEPIVSYGQDPKGWSKSSWWFTQYKGSQREKALYWREHAPLVFDCKNIRVLKVRSNLRGVFLLFGFK